MIEDDASDESGDAAGESSDAAGESSDAVGEALARARALPAAVVTALFARYGKPLGEAPPPLAADERHLAIADGAATATVRVLNVRTAVDVIGNDWFVLEKAGGEPLAVPGPLFAAALAALTRAARLAAANK